MTADIERAKTEAERARRRFADSLAGLGQQMPGAVASKAWGEVRDKGSELADDAVEAVKSRPIAASAVVAAFGLFLARSQIATAASRLMAGRKADKPEKKK